MKHLQLLQSNIYCAKFTCFLIAAFDYQGIYDLKIVKAVVATLFPSHNDNIFSPVVQKCYWTWNGATGF